MTTRDGQDLQPRLGAAALERRRPVRHHQPGADEGQQRADQGDPAAVLDVDQAAELERRCVIDDQHDEDQRAGAGRLGAADPADPLARRCSAAASMRPTRSRPTITSAEHQADSCSGDG